MSKQPNQSKLFSGHRVKKVFFNTPGLYDLIYEQYGKGVREMYVVYTCKTDANRENLKEGIRIKPTMKDTPRLAEAESMLSGVSFKSSGICVISLVKLLRRRSFFCDQRHILAEEKRKNEEPSSISSPQKSFSIERREVVARVDVSGDTVNSVILKEDVPHDILISGLVNIFGIKPQAANYGKPLKVRHNFEHNSIDFESGNVIVETDENNTVVKSIIVSENTSKQMVLDTLELTRINAF